MHGWYRVPSATYAYGLPTFSGCYAYGLRIPDVTPPWLRQDLPLRAPCHEPEPSLRPLQLVLVHPDVRPLQIQGLPSETLEHPSASLRLSVHWHLNLLRSTVVW